MGDDVYFNAGAAFQERLEKIHEESFVHAFFLCRHVPIQYGGQFCSPGYPNRHQRFKPT